MTEIKRTLWILTFEYSGIAKVGGLGEVPANQVKYLVDEFKVTVLIPSHGQKERLANKSNWVCLPFKCEGILNTKKLGLSEQEHNYSISYYMGKVENVDIIIFSGNNSFTMKYLDDEIVYNPDTFNIKLCLFSLGMRGYIKYMIHNQKENLPDIIHMHDYHVVIPFINIKQELFKYGFDISSIITFHLLTWPRYELEFYFLSGIDKTPFKVLMKEGYDLIKIEEIFAQFGYVTNDKGDPLPPTVEQIGAIISDLITTVSYSYLISDIIPFLGGDSIEFKCDFVWDGCDWNYEEINQNVLKKLGSEICEILKISHPLEITRRDMKRYLLTYKLSNLSQSPLINSKRILEAINEISNGNPFIKNGNIKCFDSSGPLIIATGRISKQKGFEVIFQALPDIIKRIPNVKFLLLILPTEYSLREIKEYAQYVKLYPENLRIVFGLAAEIFQIAHIAADAYCALSRWEPFGIMALEAMASKIPVIATQIGGLQETIIDFRNDPQKGTGLLIQKDNLSEFTQAIITIISLAKISESIEDNQNEDEINKIIEIIPDALVKSYILREKNFYNRIKENCYTRVVNHFRWHIVVKKLITLYKTLIEK